MGRGKKDPPKIAVQTAEQAGQAINIDLCFVPERHASQEKLPAVSGSSGHLVVEHISTTESPRTWPGQVFGESDLDFETMMRQYVQATQERQVHSRTPKDPHSAEPTRWRQEWEGRAERHQVLQHRHQEDAEWKVVRRRFQQAKMAFHQLTKAQRKQQRADWQAELAAWKERCEQRRRLRQERQQENQAWHQRNQQLRESIVADPQGRSWLAVLVVTDNCTRQCLGLPVFRTGPKVTSQEVMAALKLILPPELQFVISDQGKHFRTQSMAQLAQEKDFVHVLIYRHRPESNGIAERFVLTFKNWLRNRSWKSAKELEEWIRRFQPEYNERPHQGLAIPGLSPNEFANRIWLM
jgi:transposase InsO family protein